MPFAAYSSRPILDPEFARYAAIIEELLAAYAHAADLPILHFYACYSRSANLV